MNLDNLLDREPGPDALLLAAYVDGALEPAERRSLEARLARDDALLREVVVLRRLHAVIARNASSLSAWPPPPNPPTPTQAPSPAR